jgi:hypothetical protein
MIKWYREERPHSVLDGVFGKGFFREFYFLFFKYVSFVFEL